MCSRSEVFWEKDTVSRTIESRKREEKRGFIYTSLRTLSDMFGFGNHKTSRMDMGKRSRSLDSRTCHILASVSKQLDTPSGLLSSHLMGRAEPFLAAIGDLMGRGGDVAERHDMTRKSFLDIECWWKGVFELIAMVNDIETKFRGREAIFEEEKHMAHHFYFNGLEKGSAEEIMY
jgi:hypothetical protein